MKKIYLNGLELEAEFIRDDFSKAIVQHEFPYRDGSDLEDMGQNARTIHLRCFFYDETYQGHYDLLVMLEDNEELFELEHPQYGLIKGKIESVGVRHVDLEWTAEIDFNFIEQYRGEVEPVYQEDVQGKTEAVFEECQEQQAAKVTGDIWDAIGTEAGAIVDKILDPALEILEQYSELSAPVRAFVGKISELEGKLVATLTTITNPANSVIAGLSYGVNLPGRILGAIARAAERHVLLYENLADSPERFLQSFEDGMIALEESLELNETSSATTNISEAKTAAQETTRKHLQIMGAQVATLKLGEIYADDEADREKVRQAENTRSFDTEGNYVKREATPEILTINEIEGALASARAYLQAAIDQAREMQALKDMARSLLQHVNIIKLEREKIIQVEVANETPIHLLCLMYGLPYNYAPRILSINPQIENPNFIIGMVNIYAR